MPRQRRQGGFTLVELLVVIGIIAVLIGILLPVLGRVRQASNLVVCSSNLRQLSICMLMFEQEHKGKLMQEWTTEPLWLYQLKPYFSRLPGANVSIGNTQTREKILQCPNAFDKVTGDTDNAPSYSPTAPYFTNHSSFGKVQAAYGMNRWLYDATAKVAAGATLDKKYWLGTDPRTTFFKLQRTSKGQIPLFFDCRWREARPSKNTEGYFPMDQSHDMSNVAIRRHERKINVALVDGSTRTIDIQELWALQWHPTWTVPNPLPKCPW